MGLTQPADTGRLGRPSKAASSISLLDRPSDQPAEPAQSAQRPAQHALVPSGWLNLAGLCSLARPGWLDLAIPHGLARSRWFDQPMQPARSACSIDPAISPRGQLDQPSAVARSCWLEPAALCALARPGWLDLAIPPDLARSG